MRVTDGIPLGCSPLLPVDKVKCVQTLKASHGGNIALYADGAVLFPLYQPTPLSNQINGQGTLCRRRGARVRNAIGSHACCLEGSMLVTNTAPLGWPLIVVDIHYFATLKV